MTRRRKIVLTSLIAAGTLAAAGGAAAATAAIVSDPQPAALNTTPSPTPKPAPTLPDYGREACQQLFRSDVLDLPAINEALNQDDRQAVEQWMTELHQAARRAVTAEQQPVRDAAREVQTILEDGNLGDLFATPEPPLLRFALACTEEDLVSERLVDKWRGTLTG